MLISAGYNSSKIEELPKVNKEFASTVRRDCVKVNSSLQGCRITAFRKARSCSTYWSTLRRRTYFGSFQTKKTSAEIRPTNLKTICDWLFVPRCAQSHAEQVSWSCNGVWGSLQRGLSHAQVLLSARAQDEHRIVCRPTADPNETMNKKDSCWKTQCLAKGLDTMSHLKEISEIALSQFLGRTCPNVWPNNSYDFKFMDY